MNALERNLNIIIQIINYCDEIAEAIEIFGCFEELLNNRHYKNSVSMCILQIGELSGRLAEDFKEKYNNVPWHAMKAMRNVAAHEYLKMEIDVLWKTISERIPELCQYCEEILRENNVEEFTV
jgi:uncharacterized protein with HEPN domain